MPIPVSTVPLHPREERPAAVPSAQSEKYSTFVPPVFDASGALLAAYDSGSDLVWVFRSSDLTPLQSLEPMRRPRRSSSSPKGRFLTIEAYQGWAEVWNLETGQTVPDLSCDAVVSSEPEGGWLWARRWAIKLG